MIVCQREARPVPAALVAPLDHDDGHGGKRRRPSPWRQAAEALEDPASVFWAAKCDLPGVQWAHSGSGDPPPLPWIPDPEPGSFTRRQRRKRKLHSPRSQIHKMCFMSTSGRPAALLLAAALILSACSGESGADNPGPTRNDVAHEVGQPLCENEADAYLKSPGSAVYEWENLVMDGNYGEDSIEMRGTVDSQNGFGALIRSYVTCTVWVTGDQVTNAEAKVTKYRPS